MGQTVFRTYFSNIDEMMFAPLYSDKKNSRPNAPVNVIVGALILKELNGLTDDELLEECECDFRYQYALHTTSYENQPLSDRTFSRFRERNAAYELVTGRDLIHDCIVSLAENIRKYMDIAPIIKRMDSMMIESNIRQMGRLELLYTCLANLVREIARDGQTELLEGLNDYEDPNNRNRVVYHDQSTPRNEKIQKVINDAVSLLPKCKDEYGQTDDYQLLQRAIEEQTKNDDKGNRIPKAKEDGMTPDILQNPSDPDATYRSKAGKPHKGYSANLVEAVDEKGSVIVDYQYDVNTRSDASFIKEYLENAEVSEETSALITDGAYASEETSKLAADKNIDLLTTGLLGEETEDELRDELEGADMVFVTCGLGGGTGTGSAPIIAKLAKKAGALTVAVATMPFSAEGIRRRENAENGLEKLKSAADTVIIIPNDKLLEVAPNLPLNKAFMVSDEILGRAVKGITELITKSGLVSLDFADIKSIMGSSGMAMIGMGESDSGDRALESVHEALSSPLLDIDISNATGALINIAGSSDMTLHESEKIVQVVADKLDPEANIIWGAQIDESLENTIRTTIVVSGISESKDSNSITDDDFEDSQETTSNEDQLDDFIDGIF